MGDERIGRLIAARDDFLSLYPTADDLAAAVAELRHRRHTAARETTVTPVTLQDGDPCPCGPYAYPGCPAHAPRN